MTYPSKQIRDAARQVLVQKHKRHIRPLAVTAREIQQLCPGIASTDVIDELDALALADGCRLSMNINKEIMLIWEI
jgi:hypothetical protein